MVTLAVIASAAVAMTPAVLASPATVDGAGVDAAPVAPYAATFADEFNAPAGAPVDGSRWNLETGDNVNNHERQYYTNSTRNAVHDGQGNLVITARRENPANYQCWYGRCEYTSARLNTAGKFTAQYGRVEARIKIPNGQGVWPAFWLLGNNIGSVGWPQSGEIDVMENIGREPFTVHGSLHGPGYSGANSSTSSTTMGNWVSDTFHTFTVDWAPDRITWSVDGNVFMTRTPSQVNGQWVFNQPFFIILNLAIGGYWPGDPDGNTAFPSTMLVDYVRVTDSAGTGRTGTITGIGGKCLDVAGANTANGTPIQIVDCNGNAAQRWTIESDNSIRAFGKCLDVSSGSTANGAVVQLWDCNGSNAQRWAISGARDIVNIGANKCLDVVGNTSANGARVQQWECTGGANQKWSTP